MTILKRVSDRILHEYKLPAGKNKLNLTIETGLFLQIRRTPSGNISKSFIYRYSLNGKRKEEYLGSLKDLTLADARAMFAERKQIVVQGYEAKSYIKEELKKQQKEEEQQQLTFKDAVDHYLNTRDGYRESTLEGINRRLKQLSELYDKRLNELTYNDGQQIIDRKVKEGSYNQAKKLARLMRAIMNNFVDDELYSVNPLEKVGKKIPKKEVQHYKTANPENPEPDIEDVFNCIIPREKMHKIKFMLVIAFTLLRPSEALRLQISNVDFKNKILYTGLTKTSVEGYKISITPEMEKLFRWLIRDRTEGSLVKDVSIHEVEYLGRLFRAYELSMTCHGWRSAGVDWMVLHGVDENVADSCLGHNVKRSEVRKAYIRTKYAVQKIKAASMWHKYLLSVALPLLTKRDPSILEYF